MSYKEVVEVARGLVGVTYAFQQRSRELGCDCLGLILLVGWELDLFNYDIKDYGKSIGNQLKDGEAMEHQSTESRNQLQAQHPSKSAAS